MTVAGDPPVQYISSVLGFDRPDTRPYSTLVQCWACDRPDTRLYSTLVQCWACDRPETRPYSKH
ncbi:hypothetical protein J6590_099319 [Homalodisca vitripennis]|nr:hypothetical protein J6590_099319 [Homalodisca vitripennis]